MKAGQSWAEPDKFEIETHGQLNFDCEHERCYYAIFTSPVKKASNRIYFTCFATSNEVTFPTTDRTLSFPERKTHYTISQEIK